MRFFMGCHHPSDAQKFGAAFVSVNSLRRRKMMRATDWIMDSGAFTEISRHGAYRNSVEEYAGQIERWSQTGKLLAAVSQDYMCEPHIIEKTGLSIPEHQRLTIERYDQLSDSLLWRSCPTYVLPVLQGYDPQDYVAHIRAYGPRLHSGMWVGVGSVCKRNGSVEAILAVLTAILDERPDLRMHGFGLKTTALRSPLIRSMLYSADSMAWSLRARMEGRDGNDPNEAKSWAEGFGVDSEGLTRETWRSIGVNEADTWQTDWARA